jgi:hypothetical protein
LQYATDSPSMSASTIGTAQTGQEQPAASLVGQTPSPVSWGK